MQKFKSFIQPSFIPVCPAWNSNKAPSMMSESCQSGKSWLYTHILASDSRPSPRSQSAVSLLHVQSTCTNLNSVTWSQAPSLISEAWDILKLKCESWSLADSCQVYNSIWSHCWGDSGGWNCRETINRFTVKDLYGGCMVTASWAALVESLVWVLALPGGLFKFGMFSRCWCGVWFPLKVGPMNGCVDYPLDWTRCLWDAGIGASSPWPYST